MKWNIKQKKDVEMDLSKSEMIEDYTCPNCGGVLVTDYGVGASLTFCVDCDYNEYDYDF